MQPFTLWFTGLSGAGKTSLANRLLSLTQSLRPTILLDGDEVRKTLCHDLKFSESDRLENIRRIASVAKLLNNQNINVIVSAITPRQTYRELAKTIVGDDCHIVYVDCSLSTCERRDVKQLYQQARQGLIQNFTGISAPFDICNEYDFKVDTDFSTIDESVESLRIQLVEKHLLNP